MFYIMMLLLVMLGLGGMLYSWSQQARRKKLYRLLEMNSFQQQDIVRRDDTSPVERILKKSSKLVSLTAMLDKNIMAKAIAFIVLSLMLLVLDISGIYAMSRDIMLLGFLVIIMLVILLPNAIKAAAIKKRMKSISDDLPFIIDMMAVCVQSGMTVEKSLRYIADNTEDINPDIATLLDRTMIKSELSGISSALEQLYQEIPSNEVRMFCSTLQQSIKYGSSIYQVLLELSKEMRTIQLLSMEEKVASLSAKMTVPMIAFIMFPLLIIVAGPGLIGMVTMWSK